MIYLVVKVRLGFGRVALESVLGKEGPVGVALFDVTGKHIGYLISSKIKTSNKIER